MSGPIQNVYFTNPIVNSQIATLNTEVGVLQIPTRGQLISCTLAGTIDANSMVWTGAYTGASDNYLATGFYGPAQDVDVYKVVYYSTNSIDNAVVQVSGSMFVPQTVTKDTLISARLGAAQQFRDEDIVVWQSFEDGVWETLTPEDKYEGGGASIARYAGLGYIGIVPDGFGLGVNQGRAQLFDYFSETYPGVDMLRAVRSILPDYGFTASITPVNVIQNGYSAAGTYGTAIVNEFQPGVSPDISPAEAANFNFTKLMLAGVPSPYHFFNNYYRLYTYNTQPTYTFTGTQFVFEQLGLASFYFNNTRGLSDVLRKSMYAQFAQINDGDWYTSTEAFLTGVNKQITLNTVTYPPALLGGTDGNYTPQPLCPTGFVDTNQLINWNNWPALSNFALVNHGWTNFFRTTATLPTGASISNIYSTVDQVVCPANSNAQINAGAGFDGSAILDSYMGTGTFYGGANYGQGPQYAFYPGANKTINVDTSSSLANPAGQLAIANDILGQADSDYNRYRIETTGLPAYPYENTWGSDGAATSNQGFPRQGAHNQVFPYISAVWYYVYANL